LFTIARSSELSLETSLGTVAGHGRVAALMSAYEELLAAVKQVRDRTGDPNAWQTGLAPNEVAAVVSPTTSPEQLAVISNKIRQRHPGLLGVAAPSGPSAKLPSGDPPDHESGAAAEAIAHAEAALAQQNSTSSHLDMQVVSAILNAHLNAIEGKEALTRLQHETEAAVQTRSDLDTPAGARDFQRFLIGKLRDIRAVVLNASLDDTSKSALMAAWTSLYDASGGGPGDHPDTTEADGQANPTEQLTDDLDADWDPLLDSLLTDDSAPLPGDAPVTGAPEGMTAAPMSAAPAMPSIPNFGGGPLPGLTPASTAGLEGLPLAGLRGDDTELRGLDDDEPPPEDDPPADELDAHDVSADAPEDEDEAAQGGPTTLTLPDGETVQAASPQLAAAITAAVGGAPIPEAFQQQGITIPSPGTAVVDPIEPSRVSPGDIGIFVDRHALALGPGKALLDGQIQHIATVSGPNFLGWEHPPAASATMTTPARPDTPTPTRPASSSAI
jgi:Domain of unknown function (DUF4226)